MKQTVYPVLVIVILSITGCNDTVSEKSDYERFLEADKLTYDHRPDYWAQMKRLKLPKDYSIEEKLRLVAHGFDSHVRLRLADQLWEQIKDSKTLTNRSIGLMDSKDPALAFASAWMHEKCGRFHEYKGKIFDTYEREDVRLFAEKYL